MASWLFEVYSFYLLVASGTLHLLGMCQYQLHHTHTHARTPTRMHTHIPYHTTHAHMHVRPHAYIHTYMHTYIHTCIHTYLHTPHHSTHYHTTHFLFSCSFKQLSPNINWGGEGKPCVRPSTRIQSIPFLSFLRTVLLCRSSMKTSF